MRLIKMFGLASLAAVAAMAFIGATSASALFDTVLCKVHGNELKEAQLLCPKGEEQTHVHAVLVEGTVGKLLSPITVLCLKVLVDAEPLALGKPQVIHTTALKEPEPGDMLGGLAFEGCGTGAAHTGVTVTVEEAPLSHLLKTGLDEGVLLNLTGRVRLKIPSIGINCVYDLEGSEFQASANHLTAEETPTTELGGKFVCPNEGFLDGLLEMLLPTYILQ